MDIGAFRPTAYRLKMLVLSFDLKGTSFKMNLRFLSLFSSDQDVL